MKAHAKGFVKSLGTASHKLALMVLFCVAISMSYGAASIISAVPTAAGNDIFCEYLVWHAICNKSVALIKCIL